MEYWHVPLIIMKNPKQQDRTDRYIILRGDKWQKLLIAKIMFRNKEILIFDEPTSALDPLAEQEFINTLLSWYKNKTVVIISHRMTFASIADRVFVIKDGAVAEQGTPKQLLNAKGLFYEYFNTQRSLYF